MSAQDLYLAMVMTAFIVFFLVITGVWIINRIPDQKAKPRATIQAFPARRPSGPEPRQAA